MNIPAEQNSEIDVFKLVLVLLRSWKLILLLALSGAMVGFAFSRKAGMRYKSDAVLLTNAKEIDAINNWDDVAVAAPKRSLIEKTYKTVLFSQEFLTDIINHEYNVKANGGTKKVKLAEYLHCKAPHELAGKLRNIVSFNFDAKNDTLIVSAVSPDPVLSAELVNRYIETINSYYRNKLNLAAKANLVFMSKRVGEVKQELEDAEGAVSRFLNSNRGIAQDSTSAQGQLFHFEISKLNNKVKLQTDIYSDLIRKYELLKFEAEKEVPVITTIKAGELSHLPESRKTVMFTAIGMLLGCAIAAAFILGLDVLKHEQGKAILNALRGRG